MLIREKDHYTFCLSTQAGCPLACRFCATGAMGFRRNLSAGEMVTQVLTLKKELGDYAGKLNLVFMGMGEPLLNYENLARALRTISEPRRAEHLAPPRHGIDGGHPGKPGEAGARLPHVKIAFSLNAPTASLRAELMPVSRREHLDDLLAYFREHPRRQRITFEYVLLAGVNDSPAQARQLARLLHGIPAKVNLIPYNENPGPALPAPRRGGGGKIPLRAAGEGPDRDHPLVQGAGHPLGLRPAGRYFQRSLIFTSIRLYNIVSGGS